MEKIKEKELKTFLQGKGFSLITTEGENTITLIKIYFNDAFDYLYIQNNFNSTLDIDKGFEFAGIYSKKDKKIYNASNRLCSSLCNCEIIKNNTDKNTICKKMNKLVETEVERLVDNNCNNLSVSEVTDSYWLSHLSWYREAGALAEAEKLFLENKTSSDVRYECSIPVYYDLSDEAYFDFLKEPEKTVNSLAKKYIAENQEKILAYLKHNEYLKTQLDLLTNNPNSELSERKRIADAIKLSNAKSVDITVFKHNKTFTFKYSTKGLSPDWTNFSTIYIASKNQEEYARLFGEFERFGVNDIVEMSYKKKPIYKKEEKI